VANRIILLLRKGVHLLVTLMAGVVFIIICREAWRYLKAGKLQGAGQRLVDLASRHSFLDIVLVLAATAFLLWALREIAENSLVVLFVRGWKARRRYEYAMRLLGALPTAVLGSSVVVTLDNLGIYPRSSLAQYVLAILVILFVAFPTVMQVGIGLLRDYNSSSIEGYLALGTRVDETARVFVLPAMRSTMNTAVMLSASRVVIEAYLITRFASGIPAIDGDSGFLDLFRTIYSSVTVEDNVLLIFVLFLVALFVSVSFVSTPVTQRPTP